MEPVRYDDYAGVLPPTYAADEEVLLHELHAIIERNAQANGGHAVRDAHAKGYGAVTAQVEILPIEDRRYAQGIFAEPRTHDAVIRYSNGLAHVRPDRLLGSSTGLGLKLFDVAGPSVQSDDEPDAGTFDLTLINNPTFFCNTARHYLTVQQLFDQLPDAMARPATRHTWLTRFLTNDGRASKDGFLWDELMAFFSFASAPAQNLLAATHWSIGAHRHGDYIAKFRIAPTPESRQSIRHLHIDREAEDEPLRRTLVDEAGERDHEFELQVQLCTDLASMPVESTSIQWPESDSPYVTVGRMIVPRQDISGEANIEQADRLSITPWRTREAHVPLGEIHRLRRGFYRISSQKRHQINAQPRREPASVAEALQ